MEKSEVAVANTYKKSVADRAFYSLPTPLLFLNGDTPIGINVRR
jgi:hypothetical protein